MSRSEPLSLASPGESCANRDCHYFNRTDGRIQRFGKSRQGRQRYRCSHCGKCFNERTGTMFYGKHTDEETMLEVLALLAEGMRISSVSRVKGIKTDTLLQWVREVGVHAEAVEEALLQEYELSASQMDGLWSFVRNKGEKKAMPKVARRANSGV